MHVRDDVERDADHDEECITVPGQAARLPRDDDGERRPGQEDEAEERPHPGSEGIVDLAAEEPPDCEHESRNERRSTACEAPHRCIVACRGGGCNADSGTLRPETTWTSDAGHPLAGLSMWPTPAYRQPHRPRSEEEPCRSRREQTDHSSGRFGCSSCRVRSEPGTSIFPSTGLGRTKTSSSRSTSSVRRTGRRISSAPMGMSCSPSPGMTTRT